MGMNVAQKFFLGVLMITPSELRTSIRKDLNQALESGIQGQDKIFFQALLKEAQCGGLGEEISRSLAGLGTIGMARQLPDGILGDALKTLGLSGSDVKDLYTLYDGHVQEDDYVSPDGQIVGALYYLRHLVEYGGTICPKTPPSVRIFEGLAFTQFETDAQESRYARRAGQSA